MNIPTTLKDARAAAEYVLYVHHTNETRKHALTAKPRPIEGTVLAAVIMAQSIVPIEEQTRIKRTSRARHAPPTARTVPGHNLLNPIVQFRFTKRRMEGWSRDL
jgi:hypothetical protein